MRLRSGTAAGGHRDIGARHFLGDSCVPLRTGSAPANSTKLKKEGSMNNILRDHALRLALYLCRLVSTPPCQRGKLSRIPHTAHSAQFLPSCAKKHLRKAAS